MLHVAPASNVTASHTSPMERRVCGSSYASGEQRLDVVRDENGRACRRRRSRRPRGTAPAWPSTPSRSRCSARSSSAASACDCGCRERLLRRREPEAPVREIDLLGRRQGEDPRIGRREPGPPLLLGRRLEAEERPPDEARRAVGPAPALAAEPRGKEARRPHGARGRERRVEQAARAEVVESRHELPVRQIVVRDVVRVARSVVPTGSIMRATLGVKYSGIDVRSRSTHASHATRRDPHPAFELGSRSTDTTSASGMHDVEHLVGERPHAPRSEVLVQPAGADREERERSEVAGVLERREERDADVAGRQRVEQPVRRRGAEEERDDAPPRAAPKRERRGERRRRPRRRRASARARDDRGARSAGPRTRAWRRSRSGQHAHSTATSARRRSKRRGTSNARLAMSGTAACAKSEAISRRHPRRGQTA